ncbi:MAG TPA: hypothetical protein VGQ22_08445 [Steroidobacteraceae bacterium]|jgi:hypothetical protein|nr:hypothetical protein [Steroidobacteraceae bacterium]
MTNVREGGCQCGAIRYRAEGEPLLAALCHCFMCRRAPAALPPTLHYWDSKRLPWLKIADGLPRFPEFPPQE